MSHRFFVDSRIQDRTVTLSGQEAQHLIHVMRSRVGDAVTLFDGTGREFHGAIVRMERSSAVVEIVEEREVDRELPFPLTLAVALPKGDRQRLLVEKLTELGVTTLMPLITSRGVVQPAPQVIDRLGRAVIEASKQCGRNRLMAISRPRSCKQLFETSPLDVDRLIAHPCDSPAGVIPSPPSRATVIAVGPEGGFTGEEIDAATAQGWQRLDLGPRVLRVETAAIAAAALYCIRQGVP